MKITVKNIMVFGGIIAFLLFIAATSWMATCVEIPSDPEMRLKYYEFMLEVYQAIDIGFLIALLGALIPHIFTETKYEFDKRKEGRAMVRPGLEPPTPGRSRR
jgi:hypothetical protein